MPVRINLLPKYVLLKKQFKWVLIGCVALVLVYVTGISLYYANTQVEIRTLEASTANVEPNAKATEDSQKAKQKADGDKSPLDANVKFILAASQSGAERSSLLDLFYPYLLHGSVVSQIDLSDGNTATIQAMVKTPDDYARFITSIRQGTAPTGPLFAKLPVGTNGVPGFPKLKSETSQTGGGSTELTMVVFPLTVEVKGDLLNPVTIPTAPGGAAAATTGGGGEPGMDMPPDAPPAP